LSIAIARSPEQLPKANGKPVQVKELALPNGRNAPASSLKVRRIARIAVPVRSNFWPPVLKARFGQLPDATAVAMPKATVNEDHKVTTWKYNIRCARQVLSMQPKAISETMEQRPHN
jgi:hypothetical protein